MKVIIDFCRDFRDWIKRNQNFVKEDTKSRDEDRSEEEDNESEGDNNQRRRIIREEVDTNSRRRLINSEMANPTCDNA